MPLFWTCHPNFCLSNILELAGAAPWLCGLLSKPKTALDHPRIAQHLQLDIELSRSGGRARRRPIYNTLSLPFVHYLHPGELSGREEQICLFEPFFSAANLLSFSLMVGSSNCGCQYKQTSAMCTAKNTELAGIPVCFPRFS